jgi:hypothetical protein
MKTSGRGCLSKLSPRLTLEVNLGGDPILTSVRVSLGLPHRHLWNRGFYRSHA